jgi:hypothetical protein
MITDTDSKASLLERVFLLASDTSQDSVGELSRSAWQNDTIQRARAPWSIVRHAGLVA